MTENWVVRATSRQIFPDLASFLDHIQIADALV
jgi:hypothetical protein